MQVKAAARGSGNCVGQLSRDPVVYGGRRQQR